MLASMPFLQILEIVKGSLLFGTTTSECSFQQQEDRIQSLSSFAKNANLDVKQHMAFQIVCCNFMLSWLQELYMKDQHRVAMEVVSTGLSEQAHCDYEEAVELLVKHGAHSNLFFFLSGAGGSARVYSTWPSNVACLVP